MWRCSRHSTSLTHVFHPRQVEGILAAPRTPSPKPLDHTPSYNQSISRTPNRGEAAKALDRQHARLDYNIRQAVRHMNGCEGELPVEEWLQAFFPAVVLPSDIKAQVPSIKFRPRRDSAKTFFTEAALCSQLVGACRIRSMASLADIRVPSARCSTPCSRPWAAST